MNSFQTRYDDRKPTDLEMGLAIGIVLTMQ